MRPLPELTPETGWFWTSGQDGVLRIQGCTDCGQLVHPPVPICPYCRGRSAKPTEVSGRGTIIGFTVNAHQWLAGFPPPYVIGNVALAEDPRIRLTTNIVGCDPSEVRIGQEVRVRFEHDEDVWLPLFEPTGAIDPVDRVEEPVRPTPRPPASPERFEHRAVLSGIGRSKVGRRLMVDPLSLAVDASLAAVEDAGLRLEDIDGLSTYPGGGLGMGMGEGGVTALEEALRIQPTWINGGMEIPGQGGAVIAAAMAVATGLCRHVLCFRTVWESTFAVLAARSAASRGGGGGRERVSGPFREWRAPFGAMSAANWIGMNAEQYLHRYGAPREMLGLIAVTERAHAALNPDAIYRDPMTMDDYMSARPITSPFGLYDCDVPCDGSIAVIVSDASVADDLPHPAIRMEAVGTQILERLSWDEGTVTHEPQVLGQAAHLWTRTDLRPSDVDVALVYDGFSFNAISWLEGLGFCGIGEAYDWLDGGRRIALGGELPVNTHGGQLSEGRLHGFGFIYEAVTQLRHDGRSEAGGRRKDGRRVDGRGHPLGHLPPAAKGRVNHAIGGRSDGASMTPPSKVTAAKDAPEVPLEAEKPSGPRSRKGAETRARLVSAAKEVFERDGFLDARISDIAERAGLSHGSFYHYFESKEEVFREVAAEVDERLSAPLDSVIFDSSSAAGPYERIHEAIRRHLESYREEARIMGVIEQVARFDEQVGASRFERHRKYMMEVADSIRSLQRRGLVDDQLDPVIAAAGLGSMTYRFPEAWFVQGLIECEFDEGVDQLTMLFVRALGLRESPVRAVQEEPV